MTVNKYYTLEISSLMSVLRARELSIHLLIITFDRLSWLSSLYNRVISQSPTYRDYRACALPNETTNTDPPGRGRLDGHYYHAWCRTSVHLKNKCTLQLTPCVKIMTTDWLWPGGSS